MSPAYACKVSEETLGVIASESGSKFNRQFVEDWLAEYGDGYFLRDESSVFDCQLFTKEVFFDMYIFESADSSSMFRRVVKI